MKPEHQKVLDRTTIVFGDRDKAMIWLNSPCYALGNKVPMQLIDTTEGRELVLTTLGHIEHGIFV
jgi:putative toxin-antitoxin system antitoxin component (TIGR02293 family)